MVARSVERGNLGIAFFFDRDPLMHNRFFTFVFIYSCASEVMSCLVGSVYMGLVQCGEVESCHCSIDYL